MADIRQRKHGGIEEIRPYSAYHSRPSSSSTTPTTTLPSTTTTTSTTTLPPTTATSYKDTDSPTHNIKSTTKKTNEYEKHPNEVVKNEELTYNKAFPTFDHMRVTFGLVIACLTVRLFGR